MLNTQASPWHPAVINELFNYFMDKMQYRKCPLKSKKSYDLHAYIIQQAIENTWSLEQLIMVAIAMHNHTIPIFYSVCQYAFDHAQPNGTFNWRMPNPVDRHIYPTEPSNSILLQSHFGLLGGQPSQSWEIYSTLTEANPIGGIRMSDASTNPTTFPNPNPSTRPPTTTDPNSSNQFLAALCGTRPTQPGSSTSSHILPKSQPNK